MTNSPLDIVLGNILGAEHTRPDQRLFHSVLILITM